MSIDLTPFDASTRMRWASIMNAWGVPADMPDGWVEPNFEACRDYKGRYPKWSAVIDAVQNSLTDEQMSWGWWREQRIGDFAKWREWMQANRRKLVTIDESGNPLPASNTK